MSAVGAVGGVRRLSASVGRLHPPRAPPPPPSVEALNGTLRAAKKRGVVTFDAEMLLQGVHDGVDVILVKAGGGA